MTTVYTVSIGQTDQVQAPEQIVSGVRYVAFSDKPVPHPYYHVPIETPATDDESRLLSRWFKAMAGHPLLADASMVLYHDASYRLIGDLDWLTEWLADGVFVAMWHHRWATIEKEAEAVIRRGFMPDLKARRIIHRYRSHGFLDQSGVTAGGLFGWRPTVEVRRFQAIWWREIQRWNGRDQPSLDYAAFMAGMPIRHLPGFMRENAYAHWRSREEVPA